MFLRIINLYLIFKHFHQKSKPFGIKINTHLEPTIVKVKIYIYMAYFYPIWIEHIGVMLNHDPLLPLKKAKPMGNDGLG